jgi:hypothetical protein
MDMENLTGPERCLLDFAAGCEDPNPTSIEVVGRLGPFAAVLAVGKFVATFASPPPGRPVPRGEALFAIVDTRSDTITGTVGCGPSVAAARESAMEALRCAAVPGKPGQMIRIDIPG